MTAAHAEAWGASGPHSPLMNNYGAPPRLFVKGDGATLTDRNGDTCLDFLCGLAVTGLGHAHPAITEAVSTQAATLTHTSNLFANEHQAPVAETISRLIDAGPGRVLFQNSGAEANEAALKLVRKFHGRGRHGVVAAFRGFHGRTLMALAATGQPEKHEPFQPMPEGFRHVAFDDITDFERALTPEVGGVIVETVQGEGGVRPASNEYLQGLRALCDERGLLLIFDEIQTGMGRTGAWFGFQHAGVRPDIVTMAKGIANGVPVGAVWARDEVADVFGPGDHGSTFAGQPLALAAARATLAELEAIDAPALAMRQGAALADALGALSGVVSVRGRGLLLAAELDPSVLNGRVAADIARRCLDAGLIVNAVTSSALRLAPPFIVTDEQITEAVHIIDGVLNDNTQEA